MLLNLPSKWARKRSVVTRPDRFEPSTYNLHRARYSLSRCELPRQPGRERPDPPLSLDAGEAVSTRFLLKLYMVLTDQVASKVTQIPQSFQSIRHRGSALRP